MMKNKISAFRNNYPAAIMVLVFLVCSLSAKSQLKDGLYYTPINSPYSWKSGWFKTNLNIPKVIPTVGLDTGAIRYNITDSSIYVYTGSQWRQVGSGSGGGGSVSSVFGRTGAVTAASGDYSSFYPLLSGSYNNPSWINQLAWSKIIEAPAFSDSIAARYSRIEYLADSTGFVIIKPNGQRDTTVFTSGAGVSGGEVNTSSNVGSGAQLAKAKVGVDLPFRTIIGTNELTATQNTNDITLSISRGSGTRASRPASPTYVGYEYYQTDEKIGWYRWNGTSYDFITGGRLVARGEWLSYDYPTTDGGFVLTTGVSPAFATTPSSTGEGWGWNTGTSTTGSTRFILQNGGVAHYNNTVYFMSTVAIPTLSNSTDRFQVVVGDSANSSIGVFFTCIDNENGGNWVCVNRRSGGGTSRTATAITPSTSAWQKLSYNITPSEVKFYINDVLVVTHSNSANIPQTGYLFHSGITKSTGSSERYVFFDETEIRRYE